MVSFNQSEYAFSERRHWGTIAIESLKYATLMGGAYFVTKEEFLLVGACGLMYLFTDLCVKNLEEENDMKRFSYLERKINE